MAKMEEYLKQIEFAVKSNLQSIWQELAKLEKIENENNRLYKEIFESQDFYATGNPNLDSYARFEAAQRLGKSFDDANPKIQEEQIQKRKVDELQGSIAALSGSILQYAKQGISAVHGGLEFCPAGRSIGRQSLKEVIWYGRNQALHWEGKGHRSQATTACFRQLTIDFGFNLCNTRFELYQHNNRAFELIELLGWKTFEDFRSDLLLLNSR